MSHGTVAFLPLWCGVPATVEPLHLVVKLPGEFQVQLPLPDVQQVREGQGRRLLVLAVADVTGGDIWNQTAVQNVYNWKGKWLKSTAALKNATRFSSA